MTRSPVFLLKFHSKKIIIINNFKIEPATVEMIDDILEVFQSTIRKSFSITNNDNIVNYFLEIHEKNTIERIKKGNYYVLIDNGKIIGTGDFEENHIFAVYIMPEYQNIRAGNFLKNFIEEQIEKNYNSIILESSIPA